MSSHKHMAGGGNRTVDLGDYGFHSGLDIHYMSNLQGRTMNWKPHMQLLSVLVLLNKILLIFLYKILDQRRAKSFQAK